MIFVDSGPWIARHFSRDENHELAGLGWAKIQKDRVPVVTSGLVVAEVLNDLCRWVGNRATHTVAHALLSSRVIRLERPGPLDEAEALKHLLKYDDQSMEWVDCVTVAIMARLKVKAIWTFNDRHFRHVPGVKLWLPE